jgi:RNA polymerase sigma-70 factor (ECF subfamily)
MRHDSARAGIEALIDSHHEALVRRLTLILRDYEEAKEIAQEAYLRAYRAWDSFDGRDGRAWLFTIATRLALNSVRRRRKLTFRPLKELAATGQSWQPAEHYDLWRALEELPAMHRAALLLNVLDGYTQAEVADILGIPVGTVASWIASAKARLRVLVGDALP